MSLTSIIIPTYNHAAYLRGSIESSLAQTAPVEVIVVDDGSEDETQAVIATYGDRIKSVLIVHAGLAAARNAGIGAASGEFLMFLDADDVIAPDKVCRQLELMTDGIGWVMCDIRIEDVSGRVQFASDRYDYATRIGDGWVQEVLGYANFIPVHAPIVRRDVVGDLRFEEEKFPEDWHFWHAIAGRARCAYLPKVLGTYKKRPGGRNTGRWRGLQSWPGVVTPLRLNLGCGARGKDSWHPLPGFVNLDKTLGWKYQDGLRDFPDGSVAGVSISHSLMFVELAKWPRVMAEIARVLRPGGVIRITEDDTTNKESARFGGWKGSEPAITLTDALMARQSLEAVGFTVYDVDPTQSHFDDASLIQAWHGDPPHVFHIEGVRCRSVFFSPHADDEALFGAFTIIRNRPLVVICFPSSGDYGDTETRLEESRHAVHLMGGGGVEQWDGTGLVEKMRELDKRARPDRVWAPSADSSHPQHVAVAKAAAVVFGRRLIRYQTYDMDAGGKVRRGELVPFEPSWSNIKREALACYATQLAHPRARVFFDWDLAEYIA